MKLDETLWAKIADSESGCWIWTGNANPQGYAREAATVNGVAQYVNLARWMYEYFRAEIEPAWLHLDHLCSNPPCVNPWHLEPVPPHLNLARSKARGRQRQFYDHPSQAPTGTAGPEPAYRQLVKRLLADITAGRLGIGDELRIPPPGEFRLLVNTKGWRVAKSWLVAYGVAEERSGRAYIIGTTPAEIAYVPPPIVVDQDPLYGKSYGGWTADPGVVVAWPDREPEWCATAEYLAA